LGLCARTQANPRQRQRLAEQAGLVDAWQGLPQAAEEHGLAPLVYHHLTQAQIEIPLSTRRELMGLALRHRSASQVRLAAVAEVLKAFHQKGIEPMLLKGAALAALVYPEPGLRPMRDVDLLVKPAEIDGARQCLEALGYQVSPVQEQLLPAHHHHLPAYTREKDGFWISVELHRRLFPATRHYPSIGFDQLYPRAQHFGLNGEPALAPGWEELLWHIYRHAAGPPLLTIPLRYIAIADMVSLVEKNADQIDWRRLQALYPQVRRVLPLLDELVCWDDSVRSRFEPGAGDALGGAGDALGGAGDAPGGAGVEFSGWPRQPRPRSGQSWAGYLRDTLAPPEWWLRFFYGVGCARPAAFWWHRWVRHPLHLAEWAASCLKKNLRG
jgi:hypothetical protein